jgi:hypothetical protein
VGGQEETFAGLVEGGAYGEVEQDQGTVETKGVNAREGRAEGGEAKTKRASGERVKPAKQNQTSDEIGFVMPVGPIEHGRRWKLDRNAGSGNWPQKAQKAQKKAPAKRVPR